MVIVRSSHEVGRYVCFIDSSNNCKLPESALDTRCILRVGKGGYVV